MKDDRGHDLEWIYHEKAVNWLQWRKDEVNEISRYHYEIETHGGMAVNVGYNGADGGGIPCYRQLCQISNNMIRLKENALGQRGDRKL